MRVDSSFLSALSPPARQRRTAIAVAVAWLAIHNQFLPAIMRVLAISAFVAAGKRVSVTVADTGAGIGMEHMTHLFEPFFTTKPQGTGLGLAICRRIIDAHGGSIAVTPGRAHGSMFQIELPALAG